MDELLEILKKADSSKRNVVARDPEAIEIVCKNFLTPIAEQIAAGGGPAHTFLGGLANKAKPQFIAELRVQVPSTDELAPRLRIALEKRTRTPTDSPAYYDYFAGVSVVQQGTGRDEGHNAHIRWGFWSTSPKVTERITKPYEYLLRDLEWEPEGRVVSRGVLNLKSQWLTLFGGIQDTAGMDAGALTALRDRISSEMIAICQRIAPKA